MQTRYIQVVITQFQDKKEKSVGKTKNCPFLLNNKKSHNASVEFIYKFRKGGILAVTFILEPMNIQQSAILYSHLQIEFFVDESSFLKINQSQMTKTEVMNTSLATYIKKEKQS